MANQASTYPLDAYDFERWTTDADEVLSHYKALGNASHTTEYLTRTGTGLRFFASVSKWNANLIQVDPQANGLWAYKLWEIETSDYIIPDDSSQLALSIVEQTEEPVEEGYLYPLSTKGGESHPISETDPNAEIVLFRFSEISFNRAAKKLQS